MGEKTVELRRRIASTMKGREVFIYVSSPVRMIRGGFRVANVWSSDPETVWGEVASRAGVAKIEYDAYYEGCGIAHALALSDVWAHEAPVEIEGVRRALPGFRPPQSWRYAGAGARVAAALQAQRDDFRHAPYCPIAVNGSTTGEHQGKIAVLVACSATKTRSPMDYRIKPSVT